MSVATYAGHVVRGQDLLVVAQAEDEPGFIVPLAALRLAVAAVQMHLDLSFPVALHRYRQTQDTPRDG